MSEQSRFRKRHESWLGRLDMLGRPWFVLGGAPAPTLPPELVRTHARIDINNSGLTAQNLGLGPADLTIRRAKANWAAHPALQTRGLIWFTATPTPLLWARIATKHRQARIESLMRMAKVDRSMVVEHFLGEEINGIGEQGKPSNGIVTVCYGLYFDIPEIVLTGVSLTKQGHSYDTLGRPRKQVAEDTFALHRFAKDDRIATTEPELAEATGIRLWRPARLREASGMNRNPTRQTLRVRSR